MSLHSDTLCWFRVSQSFLLLFNAACWAKKQQIPILYIFCLTRPMFELTIYHTSTLTITSWVKQRWRLQNVWKKIGFTHIYELQTPSSSSLRPNTDAIPQTAIIKYISKMTAIHIFIYMTIKMMKFLITDVFNLLYLLLS